jgi:YspA, cpYpsA-related SLOG family
MVRRESVRVLVCGGRNFDNRAMLDATLDRLHAERGFSLVIAGGAMGADTLAEEWARSRGIPCEVYRAHWEGLGWKAGPIRNARMIEEGRPDLVVSFPGGRGTADCVARARAAGIEVIEIQEETHLGDFIGGTVVQRRRQGSV